MMTDNRDVGIGYVLTRPTRQNRSSDFTQATARQALRFHRTLPEYRPTRLVRLRRLARRWGLDEIMVKDESMRFGLKAFKVLGGSYAVARLLAQRLGVEWPQTDFNTLASDPLRSRLGPLTLATATDGNHGRGIAWVAEKLGLNAVIYMPKGSALSRVAAIRALGARVEVTDLNYDDTVALVERVARENDWQILQDTAWKDYVDIPRWIMQGYTTISAEASDQMADVRVYPTHVFVQAGVGAFAAAVVAHLANVFDKPPPRFIVVEPTHAACMLTSAAAADGRPHAVSGDLDTIMAGLACGKPSAIAWKILHNWACGFISCDNHVAANGMRILANPLKGDDPVEAGESGAVGVGLLDLIVNHPDLDTLREHLDIGSRATVLLFNTEGATDPVSCREILWYGKWAKEAPWQS